MKNKDMGKGNEIKTIVPALRFPEFRDTESWDNDTVDNLVDIITPPKKIILQEYLNEGDYPIVDQSQKYISGWTNDKAAVISKASLDNPIIIFGDHTCILKRITFPFAQGADGIKVIKSKDTIDGNFLYQALLVCPVVQEEYKRHFSILKQKEVFFPSIKSGEQQKIADCLSSLDDLIEATTQKVKALKEHKKGLMQRLFPAEGKNVPDLRFLEFQGAEEWKESSLDEYFDFKQGFQCPVEEQYDKQERGMVRFIRIIDLTQPSTPYRYINDPGNQYYINKENLFMVRYGDPGLVGIGYEGIIANNLFQLIPKKKINPYFFYFLFSKEKTRIKGLSSSTSLSAINFTSLKAFKIVVSQNTDEQQKIADCLSSIDELIEVISRKVAIFKEHKKGLMQQLFPKI